MAAKSEKFNKLALILLIPAFLNILASVPYFMSGQTATAVMWILLGFTWIGVMIAFGHFERNQPNK